MFITLATKYYYTCEPPGICAFDIWDTAYDIYSSKI